jgi:hypothetical protein
MNLCEGQVYCHGCVRWIDLLDTYLSGTDVLCLECDSHLGFEWDLPNEVPGL